MKGEQIFLEAVELQSLADRIAYLDRACAGDPELRARVEGLIRAHEEAGTFLDGPIFDPQPMVDQPTMVEGPGTRIGPYTLLDAIGEGGMGTVFMAEQSHPVRRKVALKIIKPGMDTKQVVARFEAERQALAMMDHPNIAKVLDGGTTDSGRPYFVMELVRGVPITEYCDREQLSVTERLELFVLVCRAVQHAHQKGIIHRDLKPSNILVTVIDGAAVPKIIDFGVAKAIGQGLTERTIHTAFHQIIGTPLYMSPEQADLASVDIDTRSDIYALGVLLYELLTGTTPFDHETFRKAAFDELRRIIREEEPPRPSTRLGTPGGSLSTVSARRKTEPRRLSQALRGELDWIVMKALEKDRNRRYETANNFAADVMRYLTDQPVEACPPSGWYRFSKYARRNGVALTTAALVVTTVGVGATLSAWQAVRATKAETEATYRAEDTKLVVKSLINDVIGAAAPAEARGEPIRIVELLRSADGALPVRFRGRPIAEAAFRRALAEAYCDLQHWDEAEQQICRAVELRSQHLGSSHPETLEAQAYQIAVLRCVGIERRDKQEEAIRLGRRVVETQLRMLGPNHRESLATLSELGQAHLQHGDFGEARDILEPTLAAQVRVLGEDASETLQTLDALGRAWHGMDRLDIAEKLLRSAVDTRQQVFGMRHHVTLATLRNLGLVVRDQGRTDEAVALLREVVAGMRAFHGSPYFRDRDHGGARALYGQLVDALRDQGNWAAIRELCEGWLRELVEMPPEPDPVVRSMKMVTLSCAAFWLAALPPGVPFDGALAVRTAEQAAEQGNDTRDNNWTRLALVHLRLGHRERAEWAVRESMKRRKGGDRFDWLAQGLIHARHGELDSARAWFRRAVESDDVGNGPGVGYGEVYDELATSLGLSPGSHGVRRRGPSEVRDEGRPLLRGNLSPGKASPRRSARAPGGMSTAEGGARGTAVRNSGPSESRSRPRGQSPP
jgi:serine/threonine protein kinase/tetratricopeptide (TPR) repeat protein